MSYQSEAALENSLLKQLEEQGFEYVNVRTVDALHQNFREILNKRHMDKLNGQPLTDREFDRLMTQINGKNIFTSSKILRDKFVLKRDDESEVYLEFFNKDSWRKNTYQVTNQIEVSDTYKGRYDVTILINGLPIVHMELKRSGVGISEAFNQVLRYKRDNFKGFFKYVQLFIVSNRVTTRYFSNNDKEIYKSSMFYWSDKDNNTINDLHRFTEDFLTPSRLSSIISKYMILNETSHQLMVMRPYQIYATEALIRQATETNNDGYVWHTTGSGKTLTSFKASQLLSERPEIKKVIFLVDRKDLDYQTMKEFNNFQKDSVDFTTNTSKLEKQLADQTQKMIVTTIQKMNNAIKRNRNVMESYKTDKVIFIIDECHRSQFGEMHTEVKRHFTNAQFFGFTGTPRFPQNKSLDGRTTADVFGKNLHNYLIKDAIRDGNVLGFNVEYMSTIKGEKELLEDEMVSGIDVKEVWGAPERIRQVTEHIYNIHNRKTDNKNYSAILAAQDINTAMNYYDEFQKQASENPKTQLNIATIFTYDVNQETHDKEIRESNRDKLARVIKDYNGVFDTDFSLESYDKYFNHVSDKVKKGIKDDKIDVLIVVNMFLTGFDSKKLNTLYVDKNLDYHNLIQAYSRTNRVETERKRYGNIVNFRNLKNKTDEAIKLFSQTDNTDDVLSKSYEETLHDFKAALHILRSITPTSEDANRLEREEDKYAFVNAFKEVARVMVLLKTFIDFDFNENELGISSQEFENFKGKYQDIRDEHVINGDPEKVSILDDIDFEIELIRDERINVSYILDLISEIDLENKENMAHEIKSIIRLLTNADDEKLRLKSELIQSFLEQVLPDLEPKSNIAAEYLNFEEEQLIRDLEEFSKNNDYPHEQLSNHLSEYQYSGLLYRKDIDKNLSGGFLKRKKQVSEIQEYIREVATKYSS